MDRYSQLGTSPRTPDLDQTLVQVVGVSIIGDVPLPRFFFHTETETRVTDREGTEYPTFEDARHEAIRCCGQMLKDAPEGFWGSRPWSVTVTDQDGLILWTIDLDGQSSPAGKALEQTPVTATQPRAN